MKKFEELKALAEKATNDNRFVGIVTNMEGQHFGFSASGPVYSSGDPITQESRNEAYNKAQADRDFFNACSPATILALLADREQLREALEADVRILGGFLDRLTPEAVVQPEISTAHLGMLEAMHCFKRAREALKKSDEVE